MKKIKYLNQLCLVVAVSALYMRPALASSEQCNQLYPQSSVETPRIYTLTEARAAKEAFEKTELGQDPRIGVGIGRTLDGSFGIGIRVQNASDINLVPSHFQGMPIILAFNGKVDKAALARQKKLTSGLAEIIDRSDAHFTLIMDLKPTLTGEDVHRLRLFLKELGFQRVDILNIQNKFRLLANAPQFALISALNLREITSVRGDLWPPVQNSQTKEVKTYPKEHMQFYLVLIKETELPQLSRIADTITAQDIKIFAILDSGALRVRMTPLDAKKVRRMKQVELVEVIKK